MMLQGLQEEQSLLGTSAMLCWNILLMSGSLISLNMYFENDKDNFENKLLQVLGIAPNKK